MQRINKNILPLINKLLINKSIKNYLPPIFILGPPRSGSTLLYQSIITYFDISYISNLHCKLHGSLVFGDLIFKVLEKRKNIKFKSNFGETEGLLSPSECGDFWYQFFRDEPTYVTLNDIKKNKLNYFKNSIETFIKSNNKNIVFKNLNASLRIQPIVKAFPNALFIIINRDINENAQSLLEARFKVNGNYETWWSIRPPSIKNLICLPPHIQVIQQILEIKNIIKKDLNLMSVSGKQIVELNYENLCLNPNSAMETLDVFFRSNGVRIKKNLNLPNKFFKRKNVEIDPSIYKDLTKYINEHDLKSKN